MSKLLRADAGVYGCRVWLAISLDAASGERCEEFGVEAMRFVAKNILGDRGLKLTQQRFIETRAAERLLDVAVESEGARGYETLCRRLL